MKHYAKTIIIIGLAYIIFYLGGDWVSTHANNPAMIVGLMLHQFAVVASLIVGLFYALGHL